MYTFTTVKKIRFGTLGGYDHSVFFKNWSKDCQELFFIRVPSSSTKPQKFRSLPKSNVNQNPNPGLKIIFGSFW